MAPKFQAAELVETLTQVVSNAVCTSDQYDKIIARIAKDPSLMPFTDLTTDPPEEKVKTEIELGLLELACVCYDNGASDKLNVPGVFRYSKTGDPKKRESKQAFNPVIRLVQEVCTLRQFCMYLAKYVWYIRVCGQKRAPAGWASRGLPRELRYVAFDFVSGVTHEAAAEVTGLSEDIPWRDLTPAELSAATAAAQVNIYHANAQAAFKVSNFLEVTHGKGATPKQRLALPPPPEVD
nr:MAG: putative coat protein [Guangxi alphaflexi-like virus]